MGGHKARPYSEPTMNRYWITPFFITLALVTFFGVLAPAFGKSFFQKELGILSATAALIDSTYVRSVDGERLLRGAMNGLLKTLDPFSLYLDPETYKEFKEDSEGRFVGTGMEVSVKGGALHVLAPLEGSPAAQAGIRPGDLILKIDGVATKDIFLADAVRKLRGEPGSKVTLTLSREDEPKPFELSVKRRAMTAKSIREAKRLENGVLYIRIAEFQKHTAEDFKEALERLGAFSARGLVLDLRNNPGGPLEQAVEVVGHFVPKGRVIVTTNGRNRQKNRRYLSKNAFGVDVGPIAVLVNRGSASGSEIVAGAVQDHGLGRVFGKKTYGKGCVQTLTPLPDGSAVRITTSHYYTPKGRLIHGIGVAPDEEIAEDPKGGQDRALAAALAWINESQS